MTKQDINLLSVIYFSKSLKNLKKSVIYNFLQLGMGLISIHDQNNKNSKSFYHVAWSSLIRAGKI